MILEEIIVRTTLGISSFSLLLSLSVLVPYVTSWIQLGLDIKLIKWSTSGKDMTQPVMSLLCCWLSAPGAFEMKACLVKLVATDVAVLEAKTCLQETRRSVSWIIYPPLPHMRPPGTERIDQFLACPQSIPHLKSFSTACGSFRAFQTTCSWPGAIEWKTAFVLPSSPVSRLVPCTLLGRSAFD